MVRSTRPFWAGTIFLVSLGLVAGIIIYTRTTMAYDGSEPLSSDFTYRLHKANQ